MRITLLLIIASLFNLNAFAQTGEIRGFVYEKETSEPSIYTNVFLKGTQYGSQTNLDGFFSISKIKPGSYTLIVSGVGYDTIRQQIDIKGGDLISKKLYLNKSVVQMQEVEVSAENEAKKSDVQISVNKITPKEIRQLPTIGGEPDLAQYLQVIPGVVFSGDQGGQLYIRGGTPIQNKMLLDGMIIYNPFHSIGLYSVLDADIIRGADIYTGGFNVEYGDRVSSIMDITTRDGNKKRFSGKVGVNTFTSKVILEGPLKKETEGSEGSSSFLLSAKTSYLDRSSKVFYSYADENGLPFSFNDLYGKVSMNSSTGSKVNFFGFRFADNVNYPNTAALGWTSAGGGTNFVLVPAGSSVLIDGNFAYSNYSIGFEESSGLDRYSDISGFNSGLNFTSFSGKDEFKYGLEVMGFKTDFQYFGVTGSKTQQTENTTQLAAYLKFKKVWDKFILEPGLRLNYYASLAEFAPEPRIGMKYNASDRLRFKVAAGYYSQNLVAANSDRDVVNLFYGFLSGPDNLPAKYKDEDITSRLQKARHLVAGTEIDLPHHFSVNIEGYMKIFNQLININRDKIYEDNASNPTRPDSLKKDFIVERGSAKGADLTIKYERKGWYFWAVYSFMISKRDDGRREYQPSFDRRHNVNLVGSYKFGNKGEWMANARWNLGSPFPFSQPQGYYEMFTLPDGIGTDINTNNGDIGTYYAELNKGRLSWFHRLDISISRTFTFGKYNVLEVTAGATNVYDRQNIFYVTRLTQEKLYQLPFIYNFGITFTF